MDRRSAQVVATAPLEHVETGIISASFAETNHALQDRSYAVRDSELEMLEKAFHKFNEASLILQKKYELLREETVELRQQLEKKEDEIKKNERLATLGQTAAALAHEIRNPLGAISLYTSILQEDLEKNPEQLEIVNAIDRSVQALNHVVSSILQFARHKKLIFSPVSLAIVIEDLLKEIKVTYPNVDLLFLKRGDLTLLVDSNSIRQLFYNLLLNAIQAQGGKGKIRITSVSTTRGIVTRVRDYGPGISAKISAEIFEPFMTDKNEGTGLGLAISREIVRYHNGEITGSNWSCGAEFKVFLPIKVNGE